MIGKKDMKVKFLVSIELEIVIGMEDDGETPITAMKVYEGGKEYDVEMVDSIRAFRTGNIYFKDGTSVYGVPDYAFEVIMGVDSE